MARKKVNSKGPDTRGYNQSDVPPKSNNHSHSPKCSNSRPQDTKSSGVIPTRRNSAIRLNETLENQLRKFLGSFPLPQTVALPSDRFEKRLTNIYDKLIDLGFASEDIRQAVLQLRYHSTLDLVLDWLCWHVDALPPRFTDERSENSAVSSSSVWVEPIAKPVNTAENNLLPEKEDASATDMYAIVASFKKLEREDTAKSKDTSMSNDHKKWLLAQYQYEQEEDDYEEEIMKADRDNEVETGLLAHPSIENVQHESDGMDQDRVELQKLRAEVEPLEAQLNDEALCYMMSKHELKALRNRVKPLKSHIKMLEGKIAGRERKAALQRSTDEFQIGPVKDDEEKGNLPDIFGSGNEETAIGSQMKRGTEDKVSLSIPKDSVPKSWTGMKPKALLEDYCRRYKLPPPSFQRMTKTSCKLRMKILTGSGDFTEIHQDAPTLADAQHFAATKALFQLDPKANLHHLLPPFHRQMWSEWKNEAQALKDRSKMDEGATRRNEIDELLSLLSQIDVGAGRTGFQLLDEFAVNDSSTTQTNDLWEHVEEPKEGNAATMSQEGIKLKREFETLQNSEGYQQLLVSREKLPVYGLRGAILEVIDKNPVTIISADTGTGKTTQVPQFLLANALLEGSGGHTSVICTQPRRVAATSVAERVAEEIGEPSVGGLVGYQIRLESVKSSRTKLLFCTTGVILRRLIEDPLLDGISHVVVDEVHERQWQIDVLLISLRKLLQTRRPDLKVVLMSATLDSELFSSYFWSAPVLKVPGRTYPVNVFFLEDLLEKTGHIIEEGSRYARKDISSRSETVDLWVTKRGGKKSRDAACLQSETNVEVSNDFEIYSMSTRRSMNRVNETVLNYDLIEDVLELLFSPSSGFTSTDGAEIKDGAVLVFLPGLREIRTLMERLAGSRFFGKNSKVDMIPMHSSLPSKDQRRAFKPSSKGCRKIIISTNIAETSVTIPDVTCVIDSGLVREIQRDQRTGTQKLVMTWCSKANTKQRCGRAGRLQPGICLKLFSSRTDTGLKRVAEAELKRIPLEEVCLTILASGLTTSCKSFLATAPEPPTGSAIDFALNDLACIGAITVHELDGHSEASEKLTALGEHLTKLPIDARLGKMLIYGSMFRCLGPALTLSACLSASQSPFASSLSEGDEVKAAHSFFYDTESDFVTLLNVWKAFVSAGSGARRFCRDKFLNYNALVEIADARKQFLAHLCTIGFVDRKSIDDDLRSYNSQSQSIDVIHFVVCAGLYPNVAMVQEGIGLFHKTEKVVIHSNSVNTSNLTERPVAFHEKLGTGHRVTVSTTCFVHPFSLFLLGPVLQIDHVSRKVEIDNWIRLEIPGKTAVLLRQLKNELDLSLKTYIQKVNGKQVVSRDARAVNVIDQIISILCQV